MSETQVETPLFNQSKRKRKVSKKDKLLQEQEELEKKVLGRTHGLFDVVGKSTSDNEIEEEKETEKSDVSSTQRKAAWVDEDDYNTEIPRKLQKHATTKSEDSYRNIVQRKFQRIVGTPNWATKKEKKQIDSDDDDIDETKRTGGLLTKKSSFLKKGIIRMEKMEDLNKETRLGNDPTINAVEFHPTYTVALVADSHGTASIVQVDGINNNKLYTVQYKGFPIVCAHFSSDGEQFYVGSNNHKSFFYYDMMSGKSNQVPFHKSMDSVNMSNFQVSPDGKFIVICGKGGNIHLLAAKTKEWIGYLKMNDNPVDICFNNDGSRMYSYGDRGEIYEWDMNTRYCVKNVKDEGCLEGIKMALSSNNQILATGSSSGFVNLYEMPMKSKEFEPRKRIDNLRTSVTSLQFNNTSEILAIASKEKQDAVKLVHFPSMTVFSNFPGFTPNIHQAIAMSFSPSSGFFAIGNNQNKVLLYRLKHYKNY